MTHHFSYMKKARRENLARWTGYTEKELWPYASANTLEKARMDIALADATTTAEPLDPISPLPDLPPAEDAAATETTRHFVQRGIGIIVDGRRIWHPLLAAYVSQYVDARYDCANDSMIVYDEDGELICTAPSFRRDGFIPPKRMTLPPPTEPWMGELHRAFSASPADTANAALRKRVAELEAENAALRKHPLHVCEVGDDGKLHAVDAYYNGSASRSPFDRAAHDAQMASNKAAYLKTAEYPGRLDSIHFLDEMAGWPPIHEERAPGPIRRFVNCLRASVQRLSATGAGA